MYLKVYTTLLHWKIWNNSICSETKERFTEIHQKRSAFTKNYGVYDCFSFERPSFWKLSMDIAS